ncbi:acyltransferase [Pseudomonas putida]|uniref:Acyltransferase n=1 Tax=Pseudomonas putida TaxID=303 RepID=A0A2Z4RU92_PSEPU|nr:acyltransferase [Pseudomonas putida]AWY43868.1 acyltransferase [Pseudomonas putida]
MKLATLLSRENNNLDIFRVVAACMVIYGHAYALVPHGGEKDFIASLLGYDYSGSLAVNIFFFLSGLVVTNSLITKRSPIDFIVARSFRIWPALIFTTVVSAIILGPIISTLPVDQYFRESGTYSYVTKNILLTATFPLPGVFETNHFKAAVNGSLWTISYEVAAYAVLLALFMIGGSRYKWVAFSIFLTIAVNPFLPEQYQLSFLPTTKLAIMLAPCFAAGSMLALFKDHIHINIYGVSGLWILFYFLSKSPAAQYVLYSGVFITILYLSSLTTIIKLKTKADISYGIYLWGFPIQQLLVKYFPEQGIVFNQIFAITLCCILGYASWVLIERNSIKAGSVFAKKLHAFSLKKYDSSLRDSAKLANKIPDLH